MCTAAMGIVAMLATTALGAAADNPVLRIMPLGDSITHGSKSVRGVDFSLVRVHVAGVAADRFRLAVAGECVKAAANGATPMAAGATLTLARTAALMRELSASAKDWLPVASK